LTFVLTYVVAAAAALLAFGFLNLVSTMTGRVQAAPVPAGGISKARLNQATLQITDSAGPNATFLGDWIVYGTSVAAPATFAGIANPLSKQISSSTTVQANQATPAVFTVTQSGLDFSAMTLADNVWACYYKQTVAPATTDVPSATLLIGVLAA
jgi:hypothetical protein